ncbi:MAG TPA: hypothetical protein VFV42_11765 [Acidimicrobiales bacterium]|nr:hypothetical protein [Acidimicrobiales bacterium]
MPDAPHDEPGPADEVLQAGIEQFQRAALEAIRAGRAVLDAAESMLQHPGAAEQVVRTVAEVARSATETVAGLAGRGWAARSSPAGADDPGADDPGDDDPDEGPPPGFQRISVE